MSDEVAADIVERHTVHSEADELLVADTARHTATEVGFDETVSEEVGLVATELAANVLDHAGSGEVTVARISEGDRAGVRIESMDAGPGIDDVDAAFADGASTAGSLGGGLGTVNRLMDRVTVAAPGEPDYGTHVVADRWVRPEYEATADCPLSFGAASRPMRSGAANGDSFVIKRWNDRALVGVIDGLGHGRPAHAAAMAAKTYVERHFDQPMQSIFAGAERACRGTRGVVMALARFDWAASTVTVASVGNINHKVDGAADLQVVTRRGVIGSNGPDPVVASADWHDGDRLVLFSDGVVSHWSFDEYPDLFEQSAAASARQLLQELGKDDDDSTVLVVGDAPEDC